MAQSQLPLHVRLWRWGVLPIIVGAVLMQVAIMVARWLPGNPHGLVAGTILGYYLGYLARTWRALLIGLNGGALCGLGLDRCIALLEETLKRAAKMGGMNNFPELTEGFFNNYLVAWSAFFLLMGLLSGFFRRGRVYVIHGCMRGVLAGLLYWIGIRTLLSLGPFLAYLGPFQMIQSLALVPLLLFSPLLKPPVDEINQPTPATHQEEEDHG